MLIAPSDCPISLFSVKPHLKRASHTPFIATSCYHCISYSKLHKAANYRQACNPDIDFHQSILGKIDLHSIC